MGNQSRGVIEDRPEIKGGESMNADKGAEWVSYMARVPMDDVVEHFDDDQLVMLGQWIASNKLLNPPVGKRPGRKMLLVKCKCGCGEIFEADYRTKKPMFKNEAHRQRYWRKRNG